MEVDNHEHTDAHDTRPDRYSVRQLPPTVYREGNTLRIVSMGTPRTVSEFIRAVRVCRRDGYESLIVDATEVQGVFPNTCVPMAAIIQFLRDQGHKVDVRVAETSILNVARFDNPMVAGPDALRTESSLSKVWEFADEQMVSRLVAAIVDEVEERTECSQGVLEALEWSLNEVMDNVLQHSVATKGYVMVQVHAVQKWLCVCVTDTGIGIYKSLASSHYRPRNAVDAITLAVREGVTRDPRIGQGNGLWGLLQIVEGNQGRLNLISGNGLLYINRGRSKHNDRLPVLDPEHEGTIVDFQIDAHKQVDIAQALGGHEPLNLRLEALEENQGEFRISVREMSHGTGTRRAAEQIRTRVINVLTESGGKVILDFSGVAIVSSSFADEFVGKLAARLGFVGFQQRVIFENVNETVQHIINRSVSQRLAESLQ